MYHILIPTDFSYGADKALKYAIDFVKDKSGDVTIFHAYEPPVLSVVSNKEEKAKLSPQVKAAKSNNLKQHVEDFLGHEEDLNFNYEVTAGDVVDNIVGLTEAQTFDLIIMGTKGAGANEHMGSNTSKVIRKVNGPVLAIPEEAAYKPIRKIVYALDFEDFNELSIKTLKAFADKFEAEIILLHVNPVEHYWEEEKSDQYHAALEAISDYDNVRFEFVQHENIGHAIEDFVKDHKVDALAMLTRDYHLIEKAYDRSLTREMLFHCEIPLLAFHE